jgi:anti-sigma factor RsiW
VRARRWLAVITLLMATACASPREKAYQQAVRDYNRSAANVAAFARAHMKQLVAATRTFRTMVGRWPQTFTEFGNFVLANNVPLDLTAFNDVTFAALDDGSVQIHYDVNCSRFSDKQYQFTQTGTVNVKAR